MTNSHRFLIGPPLLIVSVFCFVFVLMQPHTSTSTAPTASSHPAASVNADNQLTLPTIPYDSKPTLTKLTPAAPDSSQTQVNATATSTTSTNSTTSVTTSPQLSTTSTTGLQAASPNNQATNNSNKLGAKVQNLIYKLTP